MADQIFFAGNLGIVIVVVFFRVYDAGDDIIFCESFGYDQFIIDAGVSLEVDVLGCVGHCSVLAPLILKMQWRNIVDGVIIVADCFGMLFLVTV